MPKCPNCRNEVSNKDQYCFFCGAKLIKDSQTDIPKIGGIWKIGNNYSLRSIIVIGIIGIIIGGLAGWGIGWSAYLTIKSQNRNLISQQQDMETMYTTLFEEHESLQTEYDNLDANFNQLEERHLDLTYKYNSLDSKHQTLEGYNEHVLQQLENIQKVYPPKNFSSRSELLSWIRSNAISQEPIKPNLRTSDLAYERALEIQEAAAKDGFFVSVSRGCNPGWELRGNYVYLTARYYYYPYLITVWWFPDTDDVKQD